MGERAPQGVENAAVGFDPDALAPTYLLALGRPGASHALQIAERLGLDRASCASARGHHRARAARGGALLAEAAGAERDAARARAEAERDRDLAEDARAAAAASRSASSRRRWRRCAPDRPRPASRRGARPRRALAGARARARRAAGRDPRGPARGGAPPPGRAGAVAGRRPRRPRARPQAGRGRPRGCGRRRARVESALERPVPQHAAARRRRSGRSRPALGVRGTITERRGDDGRGARRGGVRMRSPSPSCSPTRAAAAATATPERPVQVRTSSPTNVASELDLRGVRADEAREAVRRFVDEAHLAGRDEVRDHPRPRHRRGAQGGARRARVPPAGRGRLAGEHGRRYIGAPGGDDGVSVNVAKRLAHGGERRGMIERSEATA